MKVTFALLALAVLFSHVSQSFPAPHPLQNSPRQLIRDPQFRAGFILLDPEPGKRIERGSLLGFDPKPVWDLCEWSSRFPVNNAEREILHNGSLQFASKGKTIRLGTPPADSDLVFGVNAIAEYQDRARKQTEPWVHLLAQQFFPDPPALSDLKKARFTIEFKLLRSFLQKSEDYSPSRHAAQFQVFFTVQNLNKSSRGYGQYLWFGVPLYDDRSRFPAEHKQQDTGGTDMFIFTPSGQQFSKQSAHDGAWISVDLDLLPLMKEALSTAWRRGFLQHSKDLADYRIGGMNLGWEVPGLFEVEAAIRRLTLEVHPQEL